MPSDYLSAAEKKKLNGEVKTYNLRKPMSYNEFKSLSRELKLEYIGWLNSTFQPSDSMVAEMMGISKRTFTLVRHELGIETKNKRGTHIKSSVIASWSRWIERNGGHTDDPIELEPQAEEKEIDAPLDSGYNDKEAVELEPESDALFKVIGATFTVDATPNDLATLLKVMFGTGSHRFTVSVMERR